MTAQSNQAKPFFRKFFRACATSALMSAFVLLTAASFAFLLIYMTPGDPVDFILKEGANLEEKDLLRKELGLDKPFLLQYSSFLLRLLQLDLGESIHTGEPVFDALAAQLPFTFHLALMSLFLALLWGLPFGVFSGIMSAHPRRRLYDRLFDALPVLFFSVPAFVAAPLLIWLFGARLGWLPLSGAGGLSHLVLPSVSLALPLGAVLMKVARASILEVLPLDYVRTARSKGLSPFRVYFRHVLRNALIPVITIAGLQMGALLTGTVIIETIFDRPGLGLLLYESITRRDYPLIQGSVLLIAVIYVFINRATDWIYGLAHPQMRSISQ